MSLPVGFEGFLKAMIQLSDLVLTVGQRPLLRGVSLDVSPGAFVAIQGESGTGKSSLIKVIIGQLQPSSGTVSVGGEILGEKTLAVIRRMLVYVPQQTAALPGETGRVFLDAPFQFRVNRSLLPSPDRVASHLAQVHLEPGILDQELGRLSGGERQRLALVRAMLLQRRIMLLDEPTSAIDSDNRRRVLEALKQLPDTTILAVSHDPVVVDAADAAWRLVDGGLEAVHGG
jgi:putative ABC transport system ATP-binding protein